MDYAAIAVPLKKRAQLLASAMTLELRQVGFSE